MYFYSTVNRAAATKLKATAYTRTNPLIEIVAHSYIAVLTWDQAGPYPTLFSAKVIETFDFANPEMSKYFLERISINEEFPRCGEVLLKATSIKGNLATVKLASAKGFPCNSRLLLQNALESGDLEMARYFIEELNFDIESPVHVTAAAASEDKETIQYLMERGEGQLNPNVMLPVFAKKGRLDFMQWIINVFAASFQGTTNCYRNAAKSNQVAIMELLYANKVPLFDNFEALNAMRNAIAMGHVATVEWLVAKGQSPLDQRAYLAWRNAAENGHVEMVRYGISQGIDLDANLYGAVARGQLFEVLDELEARGVRRLDDFALAEAIRCQNKERITKYLCENYQWLGAAKSLEACVAVGDIDTATTILSMDTLNGVFNMSSVTQCLQAAAMKDDIPMIKALLKVSPSESMVSYAISSAAAANALDSLKCIRAMGHKLTSPWICSSLSLDALEGISWSTFDFLVDWGLALTSESTESAVWRNDQRRLRWLVRHGYPVSLLTRLKLFASTLPLAALVDSVTNMIFPQELSIFD